MVRDRGGQPNWSERAMHRAGRLLCRLVQSLCFGGFLIAGPASMASGSVRAEAPEQASVPSGLGYRLVETWGGEPWQAQPGRYGRTIDISSAPDGRVFVLDGRLRAIHRLDAEGRTLGMFSLPLAVGSDRPSEWEAIRLDVGADGALTLLNRGPSIDLDVQRYRIDRMSADGGLLSSFEITRGTPGAYRDLAVRADGRIYVSRSGPGSPFFALPGPTPAPRPGFVADAVDVYRADGVFLESIATSCKPDSLDLSEDGRLYVVNRCAATVDPSIRPEPETPEPSWSPRNSQDRSRPGPLQSPPAMPSEEGVLIFDPLHAFETFEPFLNPEDVAVGPAGAFVSRNVEIFALGEDRPLYAGPTEALNAAYFDRIVFRLDLPADGRLLASMNHCSFQGLLAFDAPAERPAEARVIGALDNPHLEGPPNPARLAVGDQLGILMEGYSVQGARPGQRYYFHPLRSEARSIQRWSLAGQVLGRSPLSSQLGLCGDAARDLALLGSTVYALEPSRLQQRPDDGLPGWSFFPLQIAAPEERPHLAAVAADAGRIALLDLGRERVSLLDGSARLLADWRVDAGDPQAMPIDLDLDGDRVFLADRGRSRVLVRDLGGGHRAAWPTHDGPRALALGSEGDVFVLGEGGWGLRYRPDGRLLASWPMPDRNMDARDIAVDAEGRVYVPFARRRAYPGPRGRALPQYEIETAGVWVFEPEARPATPATRPDACLALPDKTASPARFPLGAEVTVRLSVAGRCPGKGQPTQILILVDGSRSMAFENALDRARQMLLDVSGQVDPQQVELGLVSFGDAALRILPLGRDFGELRSALGRIEARGDTHLTAGLDLALTELEGPAGRSETRRIILLASDGVFKDDPAPAFERARALGVEIYGLFFANREFDAESQAQLSLLLPDSERRLIDPNPLDLAPLVAQLEGGPSETGLFQNIRVDDQIPANMEYVTSSARPPAHYDAERHALSWDLSDVPAAAGIDLRYRLRPRECGVWPTNVEATADYLDALGESGRLVFPIPEVEPLCEPWRIYLPLTTRARCLRRQQLADVVLIMDGSSSMAEPGPDGQRSKIALARDAARSFVDLLQLPEDRVSLIRFDAQAERLLPLSGDRSRIDAALDRLETRQGTRLDLGLAAGLAAFDEAPRPEAEALLVLLTDGLQDPDAGNAAALIQARLLRDRGVLVYAIGLGREIDAVLLAELAGSPERYLESPDADALAAVYALISERLACAGSTDADGFDSESDRR